MSAEWPGASPSADCLPEDRPVPRPEDYIGKVIEPDHQVEAIETVGSKFVVFRLRNLKTGEFDQVMKVLREEFDQSAPLLEALPEALNELSRNPDRVIRICDRLLAVDATDEAIAFNKGIALLVKNEHRAALEAFNLAVSLAPKDLLNLVHRAACLATLERDSESLRDLQAAAELDTAQLKEVLATVPRHAASIRQALTRLAKTSASREVAGQALRAYFGLAMRFRLFFSRLKAKSS